MLDFQWSVSKSFLCQIFIFLWQSWSLIRLAINALAKWCTLKVFSVSKKVFRTRKNEQKWFCWILKIESDSQMCVCNLQFGRKLRWQNKKVKNKKVGAKSSLVHLNLKYMWWNLCLLLLSSTMCEILWRN